MKGSARRLFATYAVVSLLPVLVLGALLVALTSRQSHARALAQVRAEAQLLAGTVVTPRMQGTSLSNGLTATEEAALKQSVTSAITSHEVLRLRVRDLTGHVVFSDDGKIDGGVDDEALEAARGEIHAALTTLGADDNQRTGPQVVEAYVPLRALGADRVIGVVELYLPYGEIAAQVQSELREQMVVLGVGLLVLWLALLGLATRTSRALRTSAEDNLFLARHDALTGLPNRSDFLTRATRAVDDGPAVIALLDLDRFKQVNDTLGHAIGDRLLVELAGRLSDHLREGDVVARLGGDEFGLVLRGVSDEDEAVAALARVRALIAEPLVVDDLPLAIEASVGFVLVPADGRAVDVLMTKADVAMYAAKRGHLPPTRHQPGHEQYDATRLRLVGELADAIENDQLVLHYQPKTDLSLGRVTAVEALVRWQHPVLGLLYPDAFLLAAEQTELVEPLTRWVLDNALRALSRLDSTGELSVAVNFSARSLSRADFADEVLEALIRTRTSPRRLLVEITETALVADPTRAAESLTRLAHAGVRISIDDFGAGQTSLGYLAALPVHELKIDRAFVMAMDSDPRNAAIVRSVIDLGHNLGFSVTAEGVETASVLADLQAAECDSVQGYYLARPADENTIRLRLENARR
ncbi:MAG: diguanylate cyclase/phosphodiesterase [Frankiales bacterium]|nr:diguanylate cyclase/phosphodiesterase [Frankiales bacterium]